MAVPSARAAADQRSLPSASGPAPRAAKRKPYRRDEILVTAVQLFHRRGYEGTTIDDIGAATGLSGPGIYRHFRNKEEILREVLRTAAQAVLEEAHAFLPGSTGPPREQLRQLLTNMLRLTLDHPALTDVLINSRRLNDPDVRAWINQQIGHFFYNQWLPILRPLLPGVADSELQLRAHVSVGLLVSVIDDESGVDRSRIEELLVPMAMDAVLSAPESAARGFPLTRGVSRRGYPKGARRQ